MDKEYFLIQDRLKQLETTFIKDGWITDGSFECAYKFGPHIHYDIYLTKIK